MRLRSILCGLSARALLACACSAAALAADAPPADSGQPVYGTWGFDLAGRDAATRPGADFFRYANGSWLDGHEIPPDKSVYTLRIVMSDWIDQRLRGLLEEAAKDASREPASLQGKVGAYYRAFMTEDRVEQLGVKPIEQELGAVRGARSHAALARLMGRTNASYLDSVFAFGIDVDLKDPAHYSVYIGQADLGLPDLDYYLQAGFARQKAAYQAYATRLLTLLGWPHPDQRAADLVAFETRIARASWSRTEQRDVDRTYNPLSVRELERLAPDFAWTAFLDEAGLGGLPRVIIREKSAFPKLARVFAETPLPVLQAWAAFRVADNAATYLARPFAEAHFELHGRTLSGQQQQQPRWQRAIHAISGDFGSDARGDTFGTMGWAVGELYTNRYFPPAAKANIERMVSNLKAAFHARIEALDWMSPATKAEALRKLETYNIKVGYPNHPRDYSALVIRDDDVVGNVRRAAAHDWEFFRHRYSGPVDRDDWGMTPQTNNAYNGSLRDIVLPAGVLQAPIFDPNADPAINYGAAGAYISHELTHGFDDQGRKIDADGRIRDWWTAADAKEFESRAARLRAQYSAFEPLPGVHVNGELTLGENIADAGGFGIALDAYRVSLHGQPAPVLDGFSGEQRVFLGWAQAWRGKLSDDYLRKMVVSDPHSPRMYRVNGVVRNVAAWYELFGVTPEDKMYLPPADRVHIW